MLPALRRNTHDDKDTLQWELGQVAGIPAAASGGDPLPWDDDGQGSD
jgi:hypothetical protein